MSALEEVYLREKIAELTLKLDQAEKIVLKRGQEIDRQARRADIAEAQLASVRTDLARAEREIHEALIAQGCLEDRAVAAEARASELTSALIESAIPLEVLAAQIAERAYHELTTDLQAEIARAARAVRVALIPKAAAA